MNLAFEVALFLHLLAVVIWVGGMAFAHFCLRPAVADLTPQSRLPLWDAVFSRFFNWVGGAVIVLLVSGGYMMSRYGAHAPWPVMAMAVTGVVMMLIFGHLRFAMYPRLRRAVQAQNWTDGARPMRTIRTLVTINLVLGVLTIAFAALAGG